MNPTENLIQKTLFAGYLDPVKLKEGKEKCPCCGKNLRAYAKNLDKRLIGLAWDILIYIEKNKLERFEAKWILDDHQKINDFQKLHYWGIIEEERGSSKWRLTNKGRRFLMGEIQLPRKVWVFNNKVVLEEDEEMVNVDSVDERWQRCRLDYTMDYVPQKYQTEFNLEQ